MTIKFEKWHGNGNDFVIVNGIESEITINKSFIKKYLIEIKALVLIN